MKFKPGQRVIRTATLDSISPQKGEVGTVTGVEFFGVIVKFDSSGAVYGCDEQYIERIPYDTALERAVWDDDEEE